MSLESADQLKEARDVIAAAFPPADLEMLVMDHLGVPLANLVSPGTHTQRVFELLQACDARGWLERLLAGVVQERPENAEASSLVERMRSTALASSGGSVAMAASTVSATGAGPPDLAAHALARRRDEELQALVKQLDDAYARRKRNEEIGEPTAEIAREILDLKRRLREGGQLRAGDRLGSDGRYQLIQQVGRGGFAIVWKAKDRRDDIHVAIKVLHANLAGDSHRRERFFRGARMMQRLDHPAVVRVLDLRCEDGGFWYFVMEFVTNGTLHDLVLANRISGDDALLQVVRVGDALAKAHAQGMVHRDIKPANILLDKRLEAKLTDFDLVGAGDTTGGTRTGSLGTAVYAAPECLHKPQDATARADVFGLGMTAIFCLLRQELTMDMYLDLCRDPAETLEGLECSAPVRSVLAQAVARKPKQRFADAGELVAALRHALDAARPAAITDLLGVLEQQAELGVGPEGTGGTTEQVEPAAHDGPAVHLEEQQLRLRSPLPAFDHNVRYRGLVLRVVTEDAGVTTPRLDTCLFYHGLVLSRRSLMYDAGSAEGSIRSLMQAQHKAVLKNLRRGDYDYQIDSRLFGTPGLMGRAETAAPPSPSSLSWDTEQDSDHRSRVSERELLPEIEIMLVSDEEAARPRRAMRDTDKHAPSIDEPQPEHPISRPLGPAASPEQTTKAPEPVRKRRPTPNRVARQRTSGEISITRPAVIMLAPQKSTSTVSPTRSVHQEEGRSFGKGLINETSLDEVIEAYLREDADEK